MSLQDRRQVLICVRQKMRRSRKAIGGEPAPRIHPAEDTVSSFGAAMVEVQAFLLRAVLAGKRRATHLHLRLRRSDETRGAGA